MEQSVKSFVEVRRTGRYYTLNKLQPKTKNVWVVFHGYAQLAKYFIQHFSDLNPEENFIIAPEGLSRFYIDGLAGRVGASWMTKEDREEEISDQMNYINTVVKDCGIDPKATDLNIIVLGFSQGTATAVRWFANNGIRPAQLVLWAGSFPHDVDAKAHAAIFKELPTTFVYGDEDPFLQHLNVSEKTAELEDMGMQLRVTSFKGKHVMDKPTLDKIVCSFED